MMQSAKRTASLVCFCVAGASLVGTFLSPVFEVLGVFGLVVAFLLAFKASG